MTIQEIDENVRKYNVLKSNINDIIERLNNGVDSLNSIQEYIRKSYSINVIDERNYGNHTLDEKDIINNKINYLKNTVLPEIDSEIRKLAVEKERLEEEEKIAQQQAASQSTTTYTQQISSQSKPPIGIMHSNY